MVNDFADRPARALADNEILQTGRYRLQFLATPHVPHCWDAGLFFESVQRILFCSDLFFQPGDPEPLTDSSALDRTRDAILENLSGPLAHDMPYTATPTPPCKDSLFCTRKLLPPCTAPLSQATVRKKSPT